MHEAGVTFPALAALQGFENLTVHDYAIEKKGVGIFGHAEVSKNPIMRANEFLSYCFFFRGDVKKSPHRVDIVYDRSFVEESGLTAYSMDGEQSKISLITGMAIDFPSAGKIGDLKDAKATPADIVLKPAGYSQTMSQQNFVETGESKGESIDLDKFVSVLREKKIIPVDNITNPSQGVFQSDTGEIILRLREELARVVTPNSEAVALKPATKNEKLGVLTVKSTDVPASVAGCRRRRKPFGEERAYGAYLRHRRSRDRLETFSLAQIDEAARTPADYRARRQAFGDAQTARIGGGQDILALRIVAYGRARGKNSRENRKQHYVYRNRHFKA